MACLNEVKRLKKFSTNVEDEYTMALQMYASCDLKNIDFKHVHCWRILKEAPECALEGRPRPTFVERTSNKGKGKEPIHILLNTKEAWTSIGQGFDDLIAGIERPVESRTTKTTLQAQALLIENLSHNSKTTVNLTKFMNARTKVIEPSEAYKIETHFKVELLLKQNTRRLYISEGFTYPKTMKWGTPTGDEWETETRQKWWAWNQLSPPTCLEEEVLWVLSGFACCFDAVGHVHGGDQGVMYWTDSLYSARCCCQDHHHWYLQDFAAPSKTGLAGLQLFV